MPKSNPESGNRLGGIVLAVSIVVVLVSLVFEFQSTSKTTKAVISPKIIKYSEEHFTLKDGTPCVVIRYNPQALTTLGISCNYRRNY